MNQEVTPVYMDNHATTRVDPRVLEAMLPWFSEQYGNAASANHVFGWRAKEVVDQARESIASAIGAKPKEIVFTSGATESNNLAIRGVADLPRRKGNHIVSVATEHSAVLDPLEKLAARGYDVTLLPVVQSTHPRAGRVAAEQIADAIRDDTILVSVMLANNEIGALQPLEEIGRICHQREVLFHSDATQAVGRVPVDVNRFNVDLMSFSAHKIYGPKGVGALYVRRRAPRVRIEPQMLGGGHENGLRSGTLNVPGVVGFARAVELCLDEMESESQRIRGLRDRLYQRVVETVPDVALNGPSLSEGLRLPGNLNLRFKYVDGESLLLSMRHVALSSGSACTSVRPGPSHVLRAIGLPEDQVRSSVRFGLGRFNTVEEVDFVVGAIHEAVTRLRKMSSLS